MLAKKKKALDYNSYKNSNIELIYCREMAFILRPVGNILGHLFKSYLGHKFNCHL